MLCAAHLKVSLTKIFQNRSLISQIDRYTMKHPRCQILGIHYNYFLPPKNIACYFPSCNALTDTYLGFMMENLVYRQGKVP